jgi:hypothetical protein
MKGTSINAQILCLNVTLTVVVCKATATATENTTVHMYVNMPKEAQLFSVAVES